MSAIHIPAPSHGTALVIRGPQGSGISRTAISIASRLGTYRVVDEKVLGQPFELGAELLHAPAALIVEGLPRTCAAAVALKSLITEAEVYIRRKNQEAAKVPSPKVIVCSSTPDRFPSGLIDSDRRFFVVNLDAPDRPNPRVQPS